MKSDSDRVTQEIVVVAVKWPPIDETLKKSQSIGLF